MHAITPKRFCFVFFILISLLFEIQAQELNHTNELTRNETGSLYLNNNQKIPTAYLAGKTFLIPEFRGASNFLNFLSGNDFPKNEIAYKVMWVEAMDKTSFDPDHYRFNNFKTDSLNTTKPDVLFLDFSIDKNKNYNKIVSLCTYQPFKKVLFSIVVEDIRINDSRDLKKFLNIINYRLVQLYEHQKHFDKNYAQKYYNNFQAATGSLSKQKLFFPKDYFRYKGTKKIKKEVDYRNLMGPWGESECRPYAYLKDVNQRASKQSFYLANSPIKIDKVDRNNEMFVHTQDRVIAVWYLFSNLNDEVLTSEIWNTKLDKKVLKQLNIQLKNRCEQISLIQDYSQRSLSSDLSDY